MTTDLNRREILKLLSLLPAAYYLPKAVLSSAQAVPETNIIILIFDSWTASNTSLYGYPRETTPNINRLAQQAIVYHNHYAAGHYTYPSTASLFTGVLPWTHRGQLPDKIELLPEFLTENLFQWFDSHHRYAYTHNLLAESILDSMSSVIDNHPASFTLSLSESVWYEKLFKSDPDTSIVAWTRAMEKLDDGYAHTLFLSRVHEFFHNRYNQRMLKVFPRGLPAMSEKQNFLLETAIDFSINQIREQAEPFLSYIHLLPPHDPYNTRVEFYNAFQNDGYIPIKKPFHPLGKKDVTYNGQVSSRQAYDEFLLFVDSEFGRLMEQLEQDGRLGNTWIILTSDHGEMFERGIRAHSTPSFHQPLMHVPLLIFPPGQNQRVDIYSHTSTIDLLPTLLHLNQKPLPSWLEGEVLPPFSSHKLENRSLFSLDGRYNPRVGPYHNATIMLRKGPQKLTYLYGNQKIYSELNGEPYLELYNLEEDPEEMENLYHPNDKVSQVLLEEILTKMRDKNVLP